MGKNKSKKNKDIIIYKDGWINYCIKITDAGLKCPCGGNELCCHIKKLLFEKQINDTIIYMYPKFKLLISEKINDDDLLDTLNKEFSEMLNENCAFCCSDLNMDPKKLGWKMCKKCHKLLHVKCHEKWATKHPECMYCRHEPKRLI